MGEERIVHNTIVEINEEHVIFRGPVIPKLRKVQDVLRLTEPELSEQIQRRLFPKDFYRSNHKEVSTFYIQTSKEYPLMRFNDFQKGEYGPWVFNGLNYSQNMNNAWLVLEQVRRYGLFSGRKAFMEALQRVISVNKLPKGQLIHNSSLMFTVKPEDICRAALIAMLKLEGDYYELQLSQSNNQGF